MSDPVTVSIRAMVDDNERLAISIAARLLESSLGAAAGGPVTVRCQFETSLDALKSCEEPCIKIVSLLPEVDNHQEGWAEVERRLRDRCKALMTTDGAVVFLFTVFRHVAMDDSADPSRLTRIRRLDLLAAELSRETGLFVIDLDRSFADIGALKLQTDYRLGGQYASDAAAKFIALAIVSAGLDAYVSFDVQDAAKLTINDVQLSLAAPSSVSSDIKPSNVLALGSGHRKQIVATVVDTNSENHVSWLIQLMMTGQFGFKDAVSKLRRSIAHRGLRSSFAMLFAAIWQTMRGRPRMGG
jgi:hypothetical protein